MLPAVLLALLYVLMLATAQECSLLQTANQCSGVSRVLAGSDQTLRWILSSTRWNPNVAHFCLVPDGGQCTSSDSCRIYDDSQFDILEDGTVGLKLLNISSTHEGRYCVIFENMELQPQQNDCIAVIGKGRLLCNPPSEMSSGGSQCTESVSAQTGTELFLHTTLSFHGHGECQLTQQVKQALLKKDGTTVWVWWQDAIERNTLGIISSPNVSNLTIKQVNESHSGVYTMEIKLDNDEVVTKQFNVTVVATTATTTTVNPTTVNPTTNPPDPTTTDNTTPSAGPQVDKENNFYIWLVVAIGACFAMVIFTVVISVIVCKLRKRYPKSKYPAPVHTDTTYADSSSTDSDSISVYIPIPEDALIELQGFLFSSGITT